MRGPVKNAQPIASLLFCVLLSTGASAQIPTEGSKPASYDPATKEAAQQHEDGQARRKRERDELSTRSLSRLTSEFKAVETQLKEKESALEKLSNTRDSLKRAIKTWTSEIDSITSDEQKKSTIKISLIRFKSAVDKPSPPEDPEANQKARMAEEAFRAFAKEYLAVTTLDLLKHFSYEEIELLNSHGLPNTSRLYTTYGSQISKKLDELSRAEEAQAKFMGLQNLMSGEIRTDSNDQLNYILKNDLQTITASLKAAETWLDQDYLKLKRELDDIRLKKDDLEQMIDEKSTTDNKLTYAIYCMVAALVVLYVATLFAHEKIQSAIFEHRTLVEMIGMAFLLLTIIILGTGEKMDRSVLGALLGTVGGYIFGQQTRSSGRPKHRKQSRTDGPSLEKKRKKKKATGVMTENLQKAAESPAPVTQAEATPTDALKDLQELNPPATE